MVSRDTSSWWQTDRTSPEGGGVGVQPTDGYNELVYG